jgi:hypothetical protein
MWLLKNALWYAQCLHTVSYLHLEGFWAFVRFQVCLSDDPYFCWVCTHAHCVVQHGFVCIATQFLGIGHCCHAAVHCTRLRANIVHVCALCLSVGDKKMSSLVVKHCCRICTYTYCSSIHVVLVTTVYTEPI